MKKYKATIWYTIEETIEVQANSSIEAGNLVNTHVDEYRPHGAIDTDWTLDAEETE